MNQLATAEPRAEAVLETPARVGSGVRLMLWRLLATLGGAVLIWLGFELAALVGIVRAGPLAVVSSYSGPALCNESAFGGVLIFYLLSGPGRKELVSALATGGILALVLIALVPQPELAVEPAERAALVVQDQQPFSRSVLLLLAVAVSCVVALLVRAASAVGPRRTEAVVWLLPTILVPAFSYLGLYFLALTIEVCPTTFDAETYAADAAFGVQPSFLMGQVFDVPPTPDGPVWFLRKLVREMSGKIYFSLPCLLFILVGLQIQSSLVRAGPGDDIVSTFLVMSVSGFTLYMVFPVVGPVFAFPERFPFQPPPVSAVLAGNLVAVPDVARNCMPSMHTAYVLMFWWHARPFARWVRIVAAVFLVFTMLATLGYGWHYAVDLVVAFPFTLAIRALCLTALPLASPWRLGTFAAGAAGAAAWMLLIRFGLELLTFSTVLTALAALLTMGGTLVLERFLDRAARNSAVNSTEPLPASESLH